MDDANTNESGHGHIETWYDSKDKSFTVAPVYAPLEGLELGAVLSKSNSTFENTYSFQLKKLLSVAQESGCNTAATLGRSSVQNSGDQTVYGWGILTCNSIEWGSVHMNLGLTKANTQSSQQLYGIAFEYPIKGFVPHIEWLHQDSEKDVISIGIRTELIKNLQIELELEKNRHKTLPKSKIIEPKKSRLNDIIKWVKNDDEDDIYGEG